MADPLTAGDVIRAARKAKGLSLRALGALCGFSHVFLGEVERGESHASMKLLAALHAHLGLDVEYMTTLDGRLTPEATAYLRRVPAAAQFVSKLAALEMGPEEIAALMVRADEMWMARRVAVGARGGRLDPGLAAHLGTAASGAAPPRQAGSGA